MLPPLTGNQRGMHNRHGNPGGTQNYNEQHSMFENVWMSAPKGGAAKVQMETTESSLSFRESNRWDEDSP